jgi:hypothetical protein
MDNIPEGQWNALGAKKLQLTLESRAIAGRKRAIWEETRQYTWWLLTIAIALMFLGTSVGLGFMVRAVSVLAGLLVGFVLAVIAFRVIRRECTTLAAQLKLYDQLAKELELDAPFSVDEGEPAKGLPGLVRGLVGAKNMEARDWFQATFMSAAAIYLVCFIALFVYAIQK